MTGHAHSIVIVTLLAIYVCVLNKLLILSVSSTLFGPFVRDNVGSIIRCRQSTNINPKLCQSLVLDRKRP